MCGILQKNVDADVCVTQATVQEALQILRGAVMIVYPMGLPPHDPIRHEFDNTEDLSGTQVKGLWCIVLHIILFSTVSYYINVL